MKARTNVSIEKSLLESARLQGLVLSPILEEAIKKQLAELEKSRWEEDNRERITSYNKYIEENGVFSDGMRTF